MDFLYDLNIMFIRNWSSDDFFLNLWTRERNQH